MRMTALVGVLLGLSFVAQSAELVPPPPVPAPVVAPPSTLAAPPPGNFVSLAGEMSSRYPNLPIQGPCGLLVAWGSFQNKYFASLTQVGLSRADPSLGLVLLLGGGGQFHIPVGGKVLLVPGFVVGYRLAEKGAGLTAAANLAGVYRWSRMYAGLQAETLIYAPGGSAGPLLPGNVSAAAIGGMYY